MQIDLENRMPLAKPRNLAALIQMFESNYVRLVRLAPELPVMDGEYVSKVADALDLHLSIEAQSRYTTIAMLTYRFSGVGSLQIEPRARVAAQHDSRTVELLSHSRRCRPYRMQLRPPGRMPELDYKWEVNRFLQKWFGFCYRQGHLYLPYTACNRASTHNCRR